MEGLATPEQTKREKKGHRKRRVLAGARVAQAVQRLHQPWKPVITMRAAVNRKEGGDAFEGHHCCDRTLSRQAATAGEAGGIKPGGQRALTALGLAFPFPVCVLGV